MVSIKRQNTQTQNNVGPLHEYHLIKFENKNNFTIFCACMYIKINA